MKPRSTAKMEPIAPGSLMGAMRGKVRPMKGKFTVINGPEGPRVAKLVAAKHGNKAKRCPKCDKRTSKCRCPATKSEASPLPIVPVERLRWRGNPKLVKTRNVTTMGVLRKKLPFSALPVSAPTHGSSPRWETPPVPDFADIYFQPESDKRNKLEREHQSTRRLATAKRNSGMFSFHGEINRAQSTALRYEPNETLSQPLDTVDPKRLGKRAPKLVLPKKLTRLKAGQTKQGSMYGKAQPWDGGFSKKEVLRVAQALRVDFRDEHFNVGDLARGMKVEREHADAVGKSAKVIAKIALAHLRERHDYYARLREAEAKPKLTVRKR